MAKVQFTELPTRYGRLGWIRDEVPRGGLLLCLNSSLKHDDPLKLGHLYIKCPQDTLNGVVLVGLADGVVISLAADVVTSNHMGFRLLSPDEVVTLSNPK